MSASPQFAIHYEVDAFSTEGKLMGRQASGKSFMKGLAAKWPEANLLAMCHTHSMASSMLRQLNGDGFRGTLSWRTSLDHARLSQAGVVYTAAPPPAAFAHVRNRVNPAGYSLFGITHTLSSHAAMDTIAAMAAAPFHPWDALICTSRAAHDIASRLQAERRDWMREHWGATQFTTPQLPIIPLGIDSAAMMRTPEQIAQARAAFGIGPQDAVFLFAGRLSFHGKAHPAPLYAAAEATARQTGAKVVCIEAGQYFNKFIADAFAEARRVIAPSVRFIQADGADNQAYVDAWRAADVFTSLSDNVQETFGITPVEAMAAGMPVLVSDWNGYKDTVRDGIDGYRIKVLMPPIGTGRTMALRHAAGIDSYDRYIGEISQATSVDTRELTARMIALAQDPGLRARMGAAGQARARGSFDWSVVLDRFDELAGELNGLRPATAPAATWPSRPDPFTLFRGFGSETLSGDWGVSLSPAGGPALEDLLALSMVNYSIDPAGLQVTDIEAAYEAVKGGPRPVSEVVQAMGGGSPVRVAALMLLAKLDLIRLTPPDDQT
jgi:starch synthase